MRHAGLVLVAALSLAATMASPALAQKPCDEAGTQMEVNACAQGQYEAADAAMSAAYKTAMAALKDDAGGRKLLLAAQRAWLTFRDAECAAEAAPYEGGTIQPSIEMGCLAMASRARAAQLRAFSDDR